jgi:hypothetical protein
MNPPKRLGRPDVVVVSEFTTTAFSMYKASDPFPNRFGYLNGVSVIGLSGRRPAGAWIERDEKDKSNCRASICGQTQGFWYALTITSPPISQ